MAQKELKTRLQVRWHLPLQLGANLTHDTTNTHTTHTLHNPARVGEGGAAEGAAGGQATEPDPVGRARGADAVGRVVIASLIAVEPEELRQVAERPAAQPLLTPLAGLPGAAVGGRRRARGRRRRQHLDAQQGRRRPGLLHLLQLYPTMTLLPARRTTPRIILVIYLFYYSIYLSINK
jgi:hypothetical protein